MQWEKEPVGDVRFRQKRWSAMCQARGSSSGVDTHLYETRRLAPSGIGYCSPQAIAG
jgi:hypothetical protein